MRIALSARGRDSLEPGVRHRRLDGGTRTTTAASPCFAPSAPAPSSSSTPRSLPPAPSSTLTAPPQPPDPNRATRREPNINDEIATNLAGVRLATGHMPVPAPNARQEPVRAGVASTCTTCSVVSVRGARHGTGSFTEARASSAGFKPVYSPSGDEIAFGCGSGADTSQYDEAICVMNADGSGLRTLIDELGAWGNEVVWGVSPDAKGAHSSKAWSRSSRWRGHEAPRCNSSPWLRLPQRGGRRCRHAFRWRGRSG